MVPRIQSSETSRPAAVTHSIWNASASSTLVPWRVSSVSRMRATTWRRSSSSHTSISDVFFAALNRSLNSANISSVMAMPSWQVSERPVLPTPSSSGNRRHHGAMSYLLWNAR